MKVLKMTGGDGLWLLPTTPYSFKGNVSEVSYNPQWRDAVYTTSLWSLYNYNATLAEKKAAYNLTSEAADVLRGITPGGAAYFNEADVHEPDWEGESTGV
jgi:hypothetical protein